MIDNSQQLELLDIDDVESINLMSTLCNRLPELKTFKIRWNGQQFVENISTITLMQLESLFISMVQEDHHVCLLQALNCTNLKELTIYKVKASSPKLLNSKCLLLFS